MVGTLILCGYENMARPKLPFLPFTHAINWTGFLSKNMKVIKPKKGEKKPFGFSGTF